MTSFFSTCRALDMGTSLRVMTFSLVSPKSMVAIIQFCFCVLVPTVTSDSLPGTSRTKKPRARPGQVTLNYCSITALFPRQSHLAGARQVQNAETLHQFQKLFDFAFIPRHFDRQALG